MDGWRCFCYTLSLYERKKMEKCIYRKKEKREKKKETLQRNQRIREVLKWQTHTHTHAHKMSAGSQSLVKPRINYNSIQYGFICGCNTQQWNLCYMKLSEGVVGLEKQRFSKRERERGLQWVSVIWIKPTRLIGSIYIQGYLIHEMMLWCTQWFAFEIRDLLEEFGYSYLLKLLNCTFLVKAVKVNSLR